MAIFLASAYQQSWSTFVDNRLMEMGLKRPEHGNVTDTDAYALSEDLSGAAGHHQATDMIAPKQIGKAWELAASDLVLSNRQSTDWGWTSPKNLYISEYWKAFDPTTKFIFVYGSPDLSLACEMHETTDAWDPVAQTSQWCGYHKALLKFYVENQNVSSLLHIGQFEGCSSKLRSRIAKQISSNDCLELSSKFLGTAASDRLISQQLLEGAPEAMSIYEELEHLADLPSPAGYDDPIAISHLALTSAKQARKNVEDLASQVAKLEGENRSLETKVTELEQQVYENKVEQLSSTDSEEIEILRLQLAQSNEELQTYFARYNDLLQQSERLEEPLANGSAQEFEPNTSVTTKNRGADLDLSSFIRGTGWHNAEHNGRWAGVDLSSTLEIPALEAGDYSVEVHISDAMSPDIPKGLNLEFNGNSLSTSYRLLNHIGGRLAPLRRLKANLQGLEKPYPIKVSARIPAKLITQTNGAHILTLKSPRTISPATNGSTDMRDLSIFVERVELKRI